MGTITLLFTRRRNPISWLIRWALPRSRFTLALSSHCMVDAGDEVFEAHMIHGVRRAPRAAALAGAIITKTITYSVPDPAAGIAWAVTQLCGYESTPPAWLPLWAAIVWRKIDTLFHSNYDWRGALGLGFAPERNWADPSKWFCYEFGAGFIKACGRPVFANLSHVGETALMAIDP